MKKAPEAFRTISEVSEILDTPAHVLRFWESKFYQIKPVKRAGGRRYYRPDDVALIAGIKVLLQDQGLTIRGVQRVLHEQGVRHVAGLAPALETLAVSEPVEATRTAASARDETIEDAEILDDSMIEPVPSDPAAETAPEPVATLSSVDDAQSPEADDLPELMPELIEEPVPEQDAEPAPEPAEERALSTADSMDDDTTAHDGPPETPEPQQSADDPAIAPTPEEPMTDADLVAASAPAPATPPLSAPVSAPDPAQAAAALAAMTAESSGSLADTRPARVLRSRPRGALGRDLERAQSIARRLDALLERMSEASGAGRW